MSEAQLRDCELRLLRCGLLPPPPPQPQNPCILASIESGRYTEAVAAGLDAMDAHSDDFLRRVDSFLAAGGDVATPMCTAVAAFLAFVQSNITGPPLEPQPPRLISDASAAAHLMSAGSDLLANFSHLQCLVLAKMLLLRMRDMQMKTTVSWWLARVVLVQQRLLEDRSSSLLDLLQPLTRDTLECFGTVDAMAAYWGPTLCANDASTLLALLHLEAGIMEYTYARVDSCRLHFESAEAAAGLELSITGVLGFRTLHQADPKAQMVLLANTTLSSDIVGNQNPYLHRSGTFEEESEILMTPNLVQKDNQSSVPLSSIHQALILAKCLLIEKTTPHDDMQRWDMAPYIEAIDSQHSSCFTIRCFCDLLRIRWESNRSRTKERALMMMDKLVQGMYEPSPGVEQRIPFGHGVYIPPIALLRKEYGELLVSCGLIGEAVKIFEDLELWDNLIFCYRLMEKKAAAVELIKARLSVTPDDPKLWCSLGDVTNNDACYEKALEVSNNRSARAKRSLARSAYNRGEYEASKVLWESAMALNSLYPDGWFALGAAALKAKDLDKALDGFTRAVQLDPDNGEAWNNIACLHMMRKKSKESFIAFKEALKFKRNSWQLWENYAHVALDVGNISQALEAVRMVLELTNNKRTDADLLERIMTVIEERVSASPSTSFPMIEEDDTNHGFGQESWESKSRETEQLVDFLGKVLQLAVRRGQGGDLWGIYARWHKLKGDLTMCSEALLKQVRSYQGSDLWKDREVFKRFAHASLELCNVYMEISSSTGSRRELFTAEMHLKNTIKQAVTFSDMEEVSHLQSCLEELRKKIQPPSVPS